MAKADVSYSTLQNQLDAVLAELQRDDLDVDTALEQYQKGLALVKQLEAYLTSAETKIQEIKAAAEAA